MTPLLNNPSPHSDLIVAIATATGNAGVGVIRLSGSDVSSLCISLTGANLPLPRYAKLCHFLDKTGEAIDEGLLLYFPAPYSFTGEHVIELQSHGGRIVLSGILQRCLELGARLAKAGEFSQRAFLNGKIDLLQAEAIADLISAGSEQTARSAMRSLSGVFSEKIYQLAKELLHIRIHVEATLDFPEEEIDPSTNDIVISQIEAVKTSLHTLITSAHHGELLRDGIQVAILGQPNAGKSSLLNRLLNQEKAIVTSIPGTTRDIIESKIEFQGITLHIMDTAGLRETTDEVEQIGIAKTWQAVDELADVALLLIDSQQGFSSADRSILEKMPSSLPVILVLNKIDIAKICKGSSPLPNINTVEVSALTGEGIETLCTTILKSVGWHPDFETTFIARERHLLGLKQTLAYIDEAMHNTHEPVLIAESLRLAHHTLGEISGTVTSDELLGHIFSTFCIGK